MPGRGALEVLRAEGDFASTIDFHRMEPNPFRRHKTQGANNHIKQPNAFIFARNPIGATYNQLSAMLTRTFHNSRSKNTTLNVRNRPDGTD